MAFHVEMAEQAERDVIDILNWLVARQAGHAALRWFEGLEEAICSLAEMPFRCAIVPEQHLFSFEVRHLLYGRKPHVYRVVFTVENQTVLVLHVWHGQRQALPH